MKRIYPQKRNTKSDNKILNRMEKNKRSAGRSQAKLLNRFDEDKLRSRLAWLRMCSQEEARKRMMKKMGMNPYGIDGFDKALAILAAHSGRHSRRRQERERQEIIDAALKDGMIVTVNSSNDEFTLTEPTKIPEGVVVIHSPRVSF